MNCIHTGQFGINKCIQRANTAIFWPGMNNDIEHLVRICHACQKFGNSITNEPMVLYEIEKLLWYKVGMDLYELYGETFLIIVDYYSKYADIISLNKNLTTRNIIQKLKSIFSRHGILVILTSDSGTQMVSAEMKKFADDWKFQLKSSSPYHQQSNGMAEKTIGTIKKLLKKTIEENGDIYLTLLSYRNTPVYGTFTPSQILMSRILRDKIPRTKEMLMPEGNDKRFYNKMDMDMAREKYRSYYNLRTKPRKDFQEKEKIYYQFKPKSLWKRAITMSKENPITYKRMTELRKCSKKKQTIFEGEKRL